MGTGVPGLLGQGSLQPGPSQWGEQASLSTWSWSFIPCSPICQPLRYALREEKIWAWGDLRNENFGTTNVVDVLVGTSAFSKDHISSFNKYLLNLLCDRHCCRHWDKEWTSQTKTPVPKRGGPRWWCWKILSSPLPTDTPNPQLRMDYSLWKKIRKSDELLCTTMDKRTILRWVGKSETWSCKKSDLWYRDT